MEDTNNLLERHHENKDESEVQRYQTNYHITACSQQGGRKYMEDRCQLELKRNENGEMEYIFAGVYDGHGGDEASKYTRQHLLENIKVENGFLSYNDKEFLEAIRNGFLKTHKEMELEHVNWKKHQNGYNSTAGTTVTIMFIRNGKLYIGHAGDSAIFIIKKGEDRNDLSVKMATKEHKPNDKMELERINCSGGKVIRKNNCHRVVWQRSQTAHLLDSRFATTDIPFLAIARALGDFWSYNYSTNQYVVSPDPDCFTIDIDDDFMGFILCSDGVTGTLSENELSKLIKNVKDNHKKNNSGDDYNNYARLIVDQAISPISFTRSDNTTAIAIMCEKSKYEDDSSKSQKDNLTMFDLDEELTLYPKDCVVIKAKSQERKRTPYVKITYRGSKDPAYQQSQCIIGPGFEVEDISEIVANEGFTDDGSYIFYDKPCYLKVTKDQKFILDISKNESKNDVLLSTLENIGCKVLCLTHEYRCRCSIKMTVKIEIARSNIINSRIKFLKNEQLTKVNENSGIVNITTESSKNIFSYLRDKFPILNFYKRKQDNPDLKHFNSLTALPSQSNQANKTGIFSRSFDNFERLKYIDEGETNEVISIKESQSRKIKRKFNATYCNKENEDCELNPPPEKKNRLWNIVTNIVSSLSHKKE
uniref:PPM-type phosphatase domain-containing protein n=1 Tax=Parastrongyloides trichosuri TaxID=131310 RepID=A0A0N4ZNE4_PARTI